MSLADDFTTFVRAETLIFRWGKGARSFLVLRTWHGLLQSLYMDVYIRRCYVGTARTEGRCDVALKFRITFRILVIEI